jgi:hypothetical protein
MYRRIYLVLMNGEATALAFTDHDKAHDYIDMANKNTGVFNLGEEVNYSLLNVTLYGKVD